jgi:HEAT repeat protein
MTLESYIQDLSDEEKPLKHSGLLQLSGMGSEELFDFKTGWVSIPCPRKQEILSKIIELSEENLELDFTAVFRSCLNDRDEEVREIATRGLWDSDDRVVIRPLLAMLKDDPSVKVRAAAAISLGKFAGLAQDGKILSRDGERIRDCLLEVIGNQKEGVEVRRRAIEAVASFNTPEIEDLIREAYDSDDPRMRQSAIYAMGRSSNSVWLPIVLKESCHNDAGIRYEAATAIGMLGDEGTIPHLISLIKDDDVQVQVSAVLSLGTIGGPVAKRALQQTLKMGDETLEEAAQSALKNIEFDEDPLGFKFDGLG